MSKIVKLTVKNFRGVKELSLDFSPSDNLICLIGRGDSCKTTILEGIAYALSPSWNLSFYDTDFYNCAPENSIEISVSLIDFPETLRSENKYGLCLEAYSLSKNTVLTDVTSEEDQDNIQSALTISLRVDQDLEPKWAVTTERGQEKSIRGADRALLNCFMISDYVDRHFSWNKGNPLFSLLKTQEHKDQDSEENIVLSSVRELKERIDDHPFENLGNIAALVKEQAASMGLDISGARTSMDFRDINIKEGRVSLHDEKVPFRQKGKGSKRLASLAVQSALVAEGGIMLVDEIEQGLEPDRIKQLTSYLKDFKKGQIFLTTHSRDAIQELGCLGLRYVLKEKDKDNLTVQTLDFDLQKAIRACPEAFFAKKIIVCEGATEVGICRALDKWRRGQGKKQMALLDCAYVDGSGSELVKRAQQISNIMTTCLFCDSDDQKVNSEKLSLANNNSVISFDCEDGLCIEQQLIQDLPWEGVKKFLLYAYEHQQDSFESIFNNEIETDISEWQESDELRSKISDQFAKKSKEPKIKKLFKGVFQGEFIGELIFENWQQLGDETRLKKNLLGLSEWIEQN